MVVGADWLEERAPRPFGMIEIFYIVITVVVTQIYKSVKNQTIVHSKSMHFTLHKFHLK